MLFTVALLTTAANVPAPALRPALKLRGGLQGVDATQVATIATYVSRHFISPATLIISSVT